MSFCCLPRFEPLSLCPCSCDADCEHTVVGSAVFTEHHAVAEFGVPMHVCHSFTALACLPFPYSCGLVPLSVQVLTRHNNTVQIGLFVSIMASVYMAERLNTFAAANWESFSTQNYFDKRGVFISTLWSTPLLLIGTVMLFQNLYNSASLLIQVCLVFVLVCSNDVQKWAPLQRGWKGCMKRSRVSTYPFETGVADSPECRKIVL